jgi:hypothetical protein
MVVYQLGLTSDWKPVIIRSVRTLEYSGASATPEYPSKPLTGSANPGVLTLNGLSIDPHELGANVYEYSAKTHRLEVIR